ncbi:MAG: hypothetical protein FD167_1453 [bacterium]|nr:MAG: hypothetical protein FD167_1453 [bacterium]
MGGQNVYKQNVLAQVGLTSSPSTYCYYGGKQNMNRKMVKPLISSLLIAVFMTTVGCELEPSTSDCIKEENRRMAEAMRQEAIKMAEAERIASKVNSCKMVKETISLTNDVTTIIKEYDCLSTRTIIWHTDNFLLKVRVESTIRNCVGNIDKAKVFYE